MRDLCRTRGDMVQDLTRARNRLSGFLLRHSVLWRGGSTWTQAHERWLATRHFDDRALAGTYAHYLSTVRLRDSSLEAVEADLRPWCDCGPFDSQVSRLAAYRGVTRIGALCLAAEVFDWRRFPRARPFMSFTGLVPGEHSTGLSQHRLHITRAGNAHLRGQLCEAAWSYQHRPSVGAGIRQRQKDVSPATIARSWQAQVRLSSRFHQLAAHKTPAPSWLRLSPASSPGSCGQRWWPRTEVSALSVRPRSAPQLTESSTTRRSTAAADPILAGVLSSRPQLEDSTGAQIPRQPPANGCPVTPTRVHHRGGSPIHRAPARRRVRPRSPPPPCPGSRVAASTPASTPFVLALRAAGAAC